MYRFETPSIRIEQSPGMQKSLDDIGERTLGFAKDNDAPDDERRGEK
jgi:hypothetical protein